MTVYAPFFAYVCDTLAPEPEDPSPNVHAQAVAFEDELPLNEQLKPLQLEVKLATDEGGGGGADE